MERKMIAIHQTVARKAYTPTPTDIQQACEDIRATWSKRERNRRKVKRRAPRWTLPVVPLTDLVRSVREARADDTL